MNIYSRKQTWKLVLFFVALIIVGGSLFYTHFLVQSIASQEREKAKLWAEAIKERAELVKYTDDLFEKIKKEERKKGKLWAEGVRRLISLDSPTGDIGFIFEVVKNNETVPVILTDQDGRIINSRNLDSASVSDPEYLERELKSMASLYPPIEINILNRTKNYLYYKDSKLFADLKSVMDDLISSFISETVINTASVPVIYTDNSQTEILEYGHIPSEGNTPTQEELKSALESMRKESEPIEIELTGGQTNYIFYQESFVLTQLKYYPYIQLSVIGIFLMGAYFLFSTFRNAEQNQVWVGMSKETAHQLGTPISSMMAWMELLKEQYASDPVVKEMGNDIGRLETIADRFSKVGSAPKLEHYNMEEVLTKAIVYLKSRVSKKVDFSMNVDPEIKAMKILLNVPLFEWVVENLSKNAVDAMEGDGAIHFEVMNRADQLIIDISDTGKGIPKSKFKTVFQPGFTTKKRGWGLGLSLVKRIIENYHKGKIYVKSSELGKGTTFRIALDQGVTQGKFKLKGMSFASKVALALGACCVAGVIGFVLVLFDVNTPLVQVYVGGAAIAIVVLVRKMVKA